jgi:hypothetical protein
MTKAKLIQMTSTTTKYANKIFLSQFGGFSLHFSFGVEGWFCIGWVLSFDGFDCVLLLVVGGVGNELRSTLLTLVLTPLKANTQFVCGFVCTLLNPAQVLLNHFLTQNSVLKTCSQIGNLLLKLGVLFGGMGKLTLERATQLTWRG